jgi:hypothetical protein
VPTHTTLTEHVRMFVVRRVVFRGLVRPSARAMAAPAMTTGTEIEKKIRIEKDTMGFVEVPYDKYWGAQTQRSLV